MGKDKNSLSMVWNYSLFLCLAIQIFLLQVKVDEMFNNCFLQVFFQIKSNVSGRGEISRGSTPFRLYIAP